MEQPIVILFEKPLIPIKILIRLLDRVSSSQPNTSAIFRYSEDFNGVILKGSYDEPKLKKFMVITKVNFNNRTINIYNLKEVLEVFLTIDYTHIGWKHYNNLLQFEPYTIPKT